MSRWPAVAGWFLGTRIAIASLGVVGVATFATLTPDDRTRGVVRLERSALNPENVWQQWDAVWYERIARHGYGYEIDSPRGQATAGFFPLYPLTVRAVWALAPGLSFFWIGMLLSNLFTVAALYLLARSLIDAESSANCALALTLTSAGSFYLSIPYTEGLFLLLVVGTMIAARGGRYEIAGLMAGLGAATRAHGLALVAIPLVACWLDRALATRTRLARASAALASFAVPVAIYLLYLVDVHGSWDAMIARQSMWDNPNPLPFQAILGQIQAPTRISGWLHGGYWALAVALVWRYRRRLPVGETLFCAGALLISTQQDTFHGVYRYVTPMVPLMLALADDEDERVRQGFIAINLVFGVLMILAFVTGNRLAV
jgi:hypothetical protein